eukprot:TRINITY_DN1931_c0_g2_i1.p1 TRINITY_DN1931_c0_g2~~TRINITY_DN1931_c0_g2_i1.p1  ORF type:complete len:119 (+),score=1.74 TRINITY_DN1931_c0_g2_i1:72-428(+)
MHHFPCSETASLNWGSREGLAAVGSFDSLCDQLVYLLETQERSVMPHSLSPRERSPGPPSKSSRRKERTSLLVRNLPRSMRQEELRYAFTRFGPMRDAYIPRDYYTGLKEQDEVTTLR